MPSAGVAVTLPTGLWLGGAHRREVWLRPLEGDDEAFLLDLDSGAPPALRAGFLLDRCATLPDDDRGRGGRLAARLTAGDREALLLYLRRLTFGERLEAVAPCPHCGETIELAAGVGDLLLPPYERPRPSHRRRWEADGRTYDVELRVPAGADVEDAAGRALVDPAAGAALLLDRCVAAVVDGREVAAAELPEEVAYAAEDELARLDPQAELVLNAACPACRGSVSALLDAASYLLRELDVRAGSLYREVHLLALHYHWSEADILRLGARRRRRYLDLLGAS